MSGRDVVHRREVMERLDISEGTYYTRIRAGKIPGAVNFALTPHRAVWRVLRGPFEQFLAEGGRRAAS